MGGGSSDAPTSAAELCAGSAYDSTSRVVEHASSLCSDGRGPRVLAALLRRVFVAVAQGRNCFGAILHPLTMADFLMAGASMTIHFVT